MSTTLHPITKLLLENRGITDPHTVKEFLEPDYELHRHDPFLLKDMEKAVSRVLSAIEKSEKIIIYTDYDCDGVPAGALLYDFFKKIGYENFENYIPHRHEEGYGLNISAVEKFGSEGAKLLITADVGITDALPVERANELGIDVIITDHHLPNGNLPKAYAIIDPKQENDSYPYDGLCGAGVAFKLVEGLIKKGDFKIPNGWEKWLLDVAGLATIADSVPLTGENRVIAYYGLKVLQKSKRPGLKELCKLMRMRQREITEDDIAFMIAPRINAASRMSRPIEAFRLLTTCDPEEAEALAKHLHKINDERKGLMASIVKGAKKEIDAREELRELIVIGNPHWKPALLGVVANSLMESYERPVCVWGQDDAGLVKASCRAGGGVNLVEMMGETREMFIDFGGHKYSCGFSLKTEHVHTLEDVLITSYKSVSFEHEKEDYVVDTELSLEDVNWDTYGAVAKLAPFGEGNPKPVFLFKDAEVTNVKLFGKTKNHLEVTFNRGNGKPVVAIAFFATQESFKKKIEKGEKLDVVASLERSTFRNFPELRLRIQDIV
ncbi:MAG: single-stranded-DNA-specific exonuclease RecJ [Candidatus Paceibacterota bacterium]